MPKTEKVVVSTTLDAVKVNVSEIPKHETDTLCRVLIHGITEAFKNPQLAAEYEEWRAKRYGGQASAVIS